MINRKIIHNAALCLAAMLLLAAYFFSRTHNFSENVSRKISIDGHDFMVEVVTTDAALQKGLGGRSDLCRTCGMLFQFPVSGKYSFWMKDMRFPLDIIWINRDTIVQMEKNVSQTSSGTLVPIYDADRVLEINSGSADGAGFKVGDKVAF